MTVLELNTNYDQRLESQVMAILPELESFRNRWNTSKVRSKSGKWLKRFTEEVESLYAAAYISPCYHPATSIAVMDGTYNALAKGELVLKLCIEPRLNQAHFSRAEKIISLGKLDSEGMLHIEGYDLENTPHDSSHQLEHALN